MKNFLYVAVVALCGAVLSPSQCWAQSVNVNYDHQATFATGDVDNIAFDAQGDNIVLTRTNKTKATFPVKDVKSVEFSDETANFVQKYTDGNPAQVLFNCLEVNNVNPLVTLNYKLRNSGKYLFDAVILFSSNINYSKRDDEVYLHNNENVQPILLNSKKYIKPLKDQGIKVLISILGNHDGSGICNLGPERARLFAKAIADTLEKYDLDGVFFDDEYSEYGNYNLHKNIEGFVASSYTAASRLIYEIKQAIGPNRWTVIYRYGGISSLSKVDGVQPGDYIDYALSDYGVGTDMARSYPGITRAQQGIYSINLNGGYSTETQMQSLRSQNYGALMLYNLTPYAGSIYSTYQKPMLDMVAKSLFDDEVVYGTKSYPKDWKPINELREPNR